MAVPHVQGLSPGTDGQGQGTSHLEARASCQNPSSVFLYNLIKCYSLVMFSPPIDICVMGMTFLVLLLVTNHR